MVASVGFLVGASVVGATVGFLVVGGNVGDGVGALFSALTDLDDLALCFGDATGASVPCLL